MFLIFKTRNDKYKKTSILVCFIGKIHFDVKYYIHMDAMNADPFQAWARHWLQWILLYKNPIWLSDGVHS